MNHTGVRNKKVRDKTEHVSSIFRCQTVPRLLFSNTSSATSQESQHGSYLRQDRRPDLTNSLNRSPEMHAISRLNSQTRLNLQTRIHAQVALYP